MDVIKELQNSDFFIKPLPEKTVIAMAYVPFQGEQSKIFSPDQGFMLGTMYPDLNKPFYNLLVLNLISKEKKMI